MLTVAAIDDEMDAISEFLDELLAEVPCAVRRRGQSSTRAC